MSASIQVYLAIRISINHNQAMFTTSNQNPTSTNLMKHKIITIKLQLELKATKMKRNY